MLHYIVVNMDLPQAWETSIHDNDILDRFGSCTSRSTATACLFPFLCGLPPIATSDPHRDRKDRSDRIAPANTSRLCFLASMYPGVTRPQRGKAPRAPIPICNPHTHAGGERCKVNGSVAPQHASSVVHLWPMSSPLSLACMGSSRQPCVNQYRRRLPL